MTLDIVLTIVDVDGRELMYPHEFVLYQNYPNPFNPQTFISYVLPYETHVRLSVYDVLGREVEVLADERQVSGKHRVLFDASALSSGLYLYRLSANGYSQTRKLLLLK